MKRCTMNCGPALGDTRTREQCMAECEDCIDVEEPKPVPDDTALLRQTLKNLPKKEWQGLTEEEMDAAETTGANNYSRFKSSVRSQTIAPQDCHEWHVYKEIEKILKEKNGY